MAKELEGAATLMESLVVAGEKPEKLKRFMRVLKWWRASDVDDVRISFSNSTLRLSF